ncbi:MAG TPA: thiopurine S-methyltransferase [Deltaproteobacteria bacterium]|nr:thiopurine S-methyltransferase [Deltaproteobacteria bacterium]
MKADFWHERWKKGQIGFHNEEANAHLIRHWPGLDIERLATVFVPLCGKSLDMRWLRERGHPVIGIDLSPIAIRSFFEEAGLKPATTRAGPLERFSAGGFDLRCGDLFDLEKEDLHAVRGCYDRGALVALPPDLRRRYVDHLARILPERVTILLITVEYDQSKMPGPPHSVPPAEVEALYGGEFEVDPLWSSGWLEASPHFRERGLDVRRDHVFRLDRGSRTS